SGGRMASLYTRSADRQRLAKEAMHKLANTNMLATSIPTPLDEVRAPGRKPKRNQRHFPRGVGAAGLEPTKAAATGLRVLPLCRSGHPPEPRIPTDAWSRRVMGSALRGVNRAKSARANAENALDILILAPPHGTLAA